MKVTDYQCKWSLVLSYYYELEFMGKKSFHQPKHQPRIIGFSFKKSNFWTKRVHEVHLAQSLDNCALPTSTYFGVQVSFQLKFGKVKSFRKRSFLANFAKTSVVDWAPVSVAKSNQWNNHCAYCKRVAHFRLAERMAKNFRAAKILTKWNFDKNFGDYGTFK